MNIAICDDDPAIAARLEEIVAACFNGDDLRYQCDVYFSGESLVAAMERGDTAYQIYLLDIEMGGINGLEVAGRVRRDSHNAIIVFITSHGELMPEAFEVEAYHFLIKPPDAAKTQQVLLRAIEKLELQKSVLQYAVRKRVHTLQLEQIECFESRKRVIVIHLVTGEGREYYGTLKEVVQKVSPCLFAQVHTSFVVNMDHVETVSGDSVLLRSGMEILITDKYRKSFQAAYRNFVIMRAR